MQIHLFPILAILLNHFVSDFLFQTKEMGDKKSYSIKWLLIHIFVYSLTMLPLFAMIFVKIGFFEALFWWLINIILHGITDYFTSKMGNNLYKNYGKQWALTGIGFDQLIHYVTMFITYILIN